MLYWHEYNPWANDIIYIPLETAAELCSYSWPSYETLWHWKQYSDKLDAYILPQPSGDHSVGVRYGKEGNEYLSPYANSVKVSQFLAVLEKNKSPLPPPEHFESTCGKGWEVSKHSYGPDAQARMDAFVAKREAARAKKG